MVICCHVARLGIFQNYGVERMTEDDVRIVQIQLLGSADIDPVNANQRMSILLK